MNNIFKRINSLGFSCSYVDDNYIRYITYVINENEEDESFITLKDKIVKKPLEIIEQSNSFINGYKLVKLSNERYSYLRQSDNTLLPYEYDLAFDFNEYGFAMVAKNSGVSWINKEFQYLNEEGVFINENTQPFRGWSKISNFSNGKNPLSRLYNGLIAYLTPSGELKEFRYFNDGKICDKSEKFFLGGTVFNDSDYAIIDKDFLLSSGYRVSYNDLLRIMRENNLFEIIDSEVQNKVLKLK